MEGKKSAETGRARKFDERLCQPRRAMMTWLAP